MRNKFSIGQLSKLHNIPVKTLRYYDEIDLFKPIYINEETGYRYYSSEQFKQLDIIHYLKTLGVPLKEIKQQLQSRNIIELQESLKKHHETVETKINELTRIKKRLEGRIKEIDASLKVTNIGEPTVLKIPERTVVQLQEKIGSIHELELALRKLKNEFEVLSPIFLGKVGFTRTISQVKHYDFKEYNSIFLLLEDVEEQDLLQKMSNVFPGGHYVSIFYRGVRSEASSYYKVLLNFIKENNYEIKGEFIERAIVDQFLSNDEEAFLTEIQVQVSLGE
ncbi:MerR family transcriptional regulator [Schinkia azotoformans]|uniref:MerR family transcriptional regulator n=1 Tax=Schinkia azotoformans TaxID=1454 RepID=UPI002DB5AF67|nr:MerR family transcriptional regulator [Schinkia azotoformans]MEC1715995.1 MerR family transcriptional regulator [Schinkia azotoformans]MEC1740052.1 MerR family transcriptional regulator [Schinkia azotoformans]MEC1744628.1 MerR family transcriptional regulator [Schinkia azotoformans]MEC1756336.1 MerR family transcriptional regulator [Schinkia azotoformans]MEC1768115.1 MerR family transcriptional regulator [Schinkia azotoformans]